VYSIGTGGHLVPVSGSPFATGNGASDVAIDNTGKYVYAANRTDGTVSGFSIGTGGKLTALSGSPYASGTQVGSLTTERSGKYLLAAAAGGSADLTMYIFDATTAGALNKVTSTTTGVDPTGALQVVTTH
jgi:6-phosphogluconolactonase